MDPLGRLARYAARSERLLVGLMSGMSFDGLDLALVRLSGDPPGDPPSGRPTELGTAADGPGGAAGLSATLLASRTVPYDEALRARLRAATTGSAEEACRLSFHLAERWAGDVLGFLADERVAPAEVDALASHGQTLFHAPRGPGGAGAVTLQVGDGDVLAERTGLLTVSDFRPRDVAAGGEGAPLIPYADWCLWARRGEVSAALNLGSIANLTVVTEDPGQVLAFDLGPANALIDGLARACPPVPGLPDPGGIDRDGLLSARGRVDEGLLAGLVERRGAFLAAPPPKSAGFADFGPALAAELARAFAHVPGPDRVRTAVEFTALALEQALARHVRPRFPGLRTLRASGGGTRNPTLLHRLAQRAASQGVTLTALDDAFSNAKEALGFALLADATLRGRPSNLPSATGARRPALLGKISLGR